MGEAPSDGGQLRVVLDAEAAAFAGESFTGWHALCAGVADDSWQATEQKAALALCESEPDDGAVRAQARAWRYPRRLFSGEDLGEWLKRYGVTQDEWRGHIVRSLATGGGLGGTVDEGRITSALATDVVCSGLLGCLATTLTRHSAAERGARLLQDHAPLGMPDGRALAELAASTGAARACGRDSASLLISAARVLALQRAFDQFADAHATSRQLADRVGDHRIDWLTISWDEAVFATRGAAREAALMVDVDGLRLADAAARAGVTLDRRRAELGRLTPALSGRLAATMPGQTVGPWEDGDGWRLAQVRSRAEPELTDDAVRGRAREELLDDLLKQQLAGRAEVHWP